VIFVSDLCLLVFHIRNNVMHVQSVSDHSLLLPLVTHDFPRSP